MKPRSQIVAAIPLLAALLNLACSDTPKITSTFRNPKSPVERRIDDLIWRMKTNEKVELVRGVRGLSYPGNDRLGIPPLGVVQGAMGISAKDVQDSPVVATAFPANIGMAATWNPGLMEQVAVVIARQAMALGRGQVLGPLATIARSPLSGRMFESYGEDPYLAMQMVKSYVSGAQGEGVIATAMFGDGSPESRVARELDLRPFEAAVGEAGVWSVLPAAGTSATAFIGGDLAGQFGLRGFVAVPTGADVGVGDGVLLDEQVRGIMRAFFASGAFDRETRVSGDIEAPAHRAVARAAAAQSIVLLKNEGALLPLDPAKLRSLAVLGPNASVNRMAGGNFTVAGRYSATPLEALRAVFGSKVETAPDSPAEAANVARGADVAIVFVGTGAATEAESRDRPSLNLPAGQNELIAAVAKANPHTIVVGISGSPFVMGQWLGEVPAVLQAWFPGEEGGNAIADILTGVVSPSGRLPVTFPARTEDAPGPADNSGLYTGYRHFDHQGITPQFAFGSGLTYTSFNYSNLRVSPSQVLATQIAEVSVTIWNTGSRPGKETVQLYLHATKSEVERPEQELRAFEQVELKPGESRRVRFVLPPAATSHFNEQRQEWIQDRALYDVRVGSSSRDIRLTEKFSVFE